MSVSEWRLKKVGLTVTEVCLVRVLYPTDAVWQCGRSSALIVLDGQTIPSGVELWMKLSRRVHNQVTYFGCSAPEIVEVLRVLWPRLHVPNAGLCLLPQRFDTALPQYQASNGLLKFKRGVAEFMIHERL
jgi:hypothetical protein